MTLKTAKNMERTTKTVKVPRKAKTQQEIAKELREQRALDPSKSEMENYLAPTNRHFGF